MTKEDDYRISAAKSVELAARASTSADKGHLLALAECWLELADSAHHRAEQPIRQSNDHPLVKAKLGPASL